MDSFDDATKAEVLREAKLLELIKHENIIRFKEVYKNDDDKLCIVTEHASGGDIHDKIE